MELRRIARAAQPMIRTLAVCAILLGGAAAHAQIPVISGPAGIPVHLVAAPDGVPVKLIAGPAGVPVHIVDAPDGIPVHVSAEASAKQASAQTILLANILLSLKEIEAAIIGRPSPASTP